MSIEALEKAIRIAGGQTELARKIGPPVRQGHVSMWLKRGVTPAEHCRSIEAATDGEVTRYELRPDVFGDQPVPAFPNDRQQEAA